MAKLKIIPTRFARTPEQLTRDFISWYQVGKIEMTTQLVHGMHEVKFVKEDGSVLCAGRHAILTYAVIGAIWGHIK